MINKNNKHIRKIRHDAKALSPVVASIILIAVTVAVSIAVAAWMGGMTIGFMGSTSATITDVQFTDDGATIILALNNTGTKSVTIAAIRVNDIRAPDSALAADPDFTIAPGTGTEITITMTTSPLSDWVSGNPYKIDIYDGSNQVVGSTQQTPPETA